MACLDFADEGLRFYEIRLEGLEDLTALFADGGVALTTLFGIQLRTLWPYCGRVRFGCRGGFSRRLRVFLIGFLDVVGEIPGELAGVLAGSEFQGLSDDGIEEVPVVGNDEESTGVVDERLLQDVLRLHVEVVGGFVEDQEVGRAHQHTDEGDTGSFSATEDADLFKNVVTFKKEAAENIAGRHGSTTSLDHLDRFQDGESGIEFVCVVLVEEGWERLGAEFVKARGRIFLAGDHSAEGRFSSSVGSNDGNFFTAGDFEIEVLEDGEVLTIFQLVDLRGAFELGHEMGRGGGIGEAEGD